MNSYNPFPDSTTIVPYGKFIFHVASHASYVLSSQMLIIVKLHGRESTIHWCTILDRDDSKEYETALEKLLAKAAEEINGAG